MIILSLVVTMGLAVSISEVDLASGKETLRDNGPHHHTCCVLKLIHTIV